ncbi:MAG: hypothetical protein ACC682_04260 [Gemmatimonadota bacterium]
MRHDLHSALYTSLHTALVGLGLVLGGSPATVLGQECEIDDSPGHAYWHEGQLALQAFEDTVKGLLVEAGGSPVGGLSIRRDPDSGDVAVEPRMLTIPDAGRDRFSAALDVLLAANELESGDEITLDLGQPRPELWADRTERCEPELDNVAEIGGLVAQVVVGAIAQEGKARPAGRVRINLWTRVDWTGRVGAMELREDGGKWRWLAPYLQALAPAMRYRPATLNGVPRTTWMSQPFELEF